MVTTLALLLAGCCAACGTPPRPLGGVLVLRGGKRAPPPSPPSLLSTKLVPEWSGVTTDALVGGATGYGCGLVIGTTIAESTKAAVSLTKLLVSQTASAVVLSRLAANLGLITFHWERFGLLGWRLFKYLDADGDGKLTQVDLNLGATRLLPCVWRARLFKMLDRDGDGKLTSKDGELMAAGNKHAAIGGIAGFAIGVMQGLGLG